MGEVIDFGRRRRRPPQRPAQAATPAGPRILRCHHCGERHPVVRLAGGDARLDPMNWSPEASRRARAFASYAALRSLGRSGIDELVTRHCRLARRFAERLAAIQARITGK